MAINVDCPSCKTNQDVGEELIGRYTHCRQCNCRFYVQVPALGEHKIGVFEPPRRNARTTAADKELTVHDLFHDAQQGEAVILRELRAQHDLLRKMSLALFLTLFCALCSCGLLAWIAWHA